MTLSGKTAVVTGSTSGIGLGIAEELARAGANVVLNSFTDTEEDHGRAAEIARAHGVEARYIRADMSKGEDCRRLIAEAGGCDILVNNAGIAVTKPFLQQGLEDWDGVMAVNLRGCFLVGQEAAKRLAGAKQPGSIINIASVLGERIIPGVAGYTAAKAGLLHLTRQMAVELARFSIRVNAIAPGYVATDINRDYFASEAGQAMIRRIPQRRLGSPADLTGALLLLASDAGAHMTGTTVTVDGGHSVNPL